MHSKVSNSLNSYSFYSLPPAPIIESLRLYGNEFNLTSEYKCPDFIDDCRVSCDVMDDEECRSHP